jgi:hypothetical protein
MVTWSSWWDENWHRKLKYFIPILLDLGLNLGCSNGTPATNCLSYGMAHFMLKNRHSIGD